MIRAALVLGTCCALLVLNCAPGEPAKNPCPPETLAAIEARYAAEVVAECPDEATRNECAALPNLKAGREQAEKDASCR